jgi:hypothetical protein
MVTATSIWDLWRACAVISPCHSSLLPRPDHLAYFSLDGCHLAETLDWCRPVEPFDSFPEVLHSHADAADSISTYIAPMMCGFSGNPLPPALPPHRDWALSGCSSEGACHSPTLPAQSWISCAPQKHAILGQSFHLWLCAWNDLCDRDLLRHLCRFCELV